MKRKNIIIAILMMAVIVITGLATHDVDTQINLDTGTIRSVYRSLGVTIYSTPPITTTLSRVLGNKKDNSDWLNVYRDEFSIPTTRTNPCYPKMLHRFGIIPRTFNNDEISILTADLALRELSESKNTCHLKDHLERFYFALMESEVYTWDSIKIQSDIPRLWKISETEQAAPSNR